MAPSSHAARNCFSRGSGHGPVIVFEMIDVDDAESEGMPRNATTSAVLDGQVHL